MSYERLAYDDQDSSSRMYDDCTACAGSIDLPRRRIDPASLAVPAPSLTFDQYPRDVHERDIEVSDAAAHLAATFHLHLD